VIMHSKSASIAFLALVLILAHADSSIAAEEESLPSYRLSVSFDLTNNLLRGTTAITLPEAGAAVSPGTLKIISVVLIGVPVEYHIADPLIKIASKGLIEITYEGTSRGDGETRKNTENAGVVGAGLVIMP